jgi:anti-sigma B factor antagonist
MVDRPFSVEVHHDADRGVAAPWGDLDLSTAPALAAAVDELLATEDVQRLVVDLAGVDFVDSSGLTSLIHARRRADEADVAFALRAPSARVLRTLELMRLTTIFEIE